MKFKAHVAGLVETIKPMFVATTKSVMDNYANSGTITFELDNDGLNLIVDCGYINAISNIGTNNNTIDLVSIEHGTATVNVTDLMNALSSFTSCTSVMIEDNGGDDSNAFVISNNDDKQEFQSLPKEQIQNKYEYEQIKQKNANISLNKSIFCKYAKKISVAFTQQEYHKQYNYWMLRTCKNKELRFTAGTGSFFALVDLSNLGSNLSSAKGDILFPIKQTTAVLDILDKLHADTMDIVLAENFIFITCGNLRMRLLTDTNMQYPNENRLIELESAYKFTTKAERWQDAIKGINATFDSSFKRQNRMHLCKLEMDFDKKIIHAQTTETVSKSHRKIQMSEVATNEEQRGLSFTSCSKFFDDAIKMASKDEYIQCELSGEDDILKIRYYAGEFVGDPLSFTKTDSLGIHERMTVFFCPAR